MDFEEHCINGLAFSSLAALAPRMLVLRISRRSLSLAPRNAPFGPRIRRTGPEPKRPAQAPPIGLKAQREAADLQRSVRAGSERCERDPFTKNTHF